MTKALIIGGGIAGPAVAMALRRAGIISAIHEAYHRPADDIGPSSTMYTYHVDWNGTVT